MLPIATPSLALQRDSGTGEREGEHGSGEVKPRGQERGARRSVRTRRDVKRDKGLRALLTHHSCVAASRLSLAWLWI